MRALCYGAQRVESKYLGRAADGGEGAVESREQRRQGDGTTNAPSTWIVSSSPMPSCLTATTRRVLPDTAVPSRYDTQIDQLTPGERFLRALALSACVRGLAWQEARLNAATPDTVGVVLRFVQQLSGEDVALMWQRRTDDRNRE